MFDEEVLVLIEVSFEASDFNETKFVVVGCDSGGVFDATVFCRTKAFKLVC